MNRIVVKAVSLVVQADNEMSVPTMLWGPPGIGKTSIIKQIAVILGRSLEIVIASSKDPADVIGIDYIVDDPKIGKISTKIPPSWAVRALKRIDEGKKTIVFFDEITTAPQMVQNVLLSTMQDRLLGDIYLPYEFISIVSAGNPSEITGETLSQAMANRLFHIECSYDRGAFVKYLRYGGVTEKDIAMLNPDYMKKYQDLKELLAIYLENIDDFAGKGPINDEMREKPHPTPRSTDNMLKLLSLVDDNDPDSVEIENLFASGTVGGDGMKFLIWLRKKADLPSVDDVLSEKVSLDYERLDLVLLFIHQIVNKFRAVFDSADRKDFVKKLVKFTENLCEYRIEAVPVLLSPILEEYSKKNTPIDTPILNSSKLMSILHKITS